MIQVAEADERVVLVDEEDRELGTADKLGAHRTAQLHRAFSVFVFDADGRLLLQQRDAAKYHSGGRWSNTCCGHPRPGERTADAARRRLREEMGFSCELEEAFSFTYRAELEHGLVEHEFDHVFVGRWDGEPLPNPAEVQSWRYVAVDELVADLHSSPERFSAWFRPAFEEIVRRRLHTRAGADEHPASPFALGR